MTNSSSVDFSITGTATVAGAFLNTAATGTAGILYGVVDFSSSRAVISGDTLQVTVTVTAASA
jgi:acyl dehydratase